MSNIWGQICCQHFWQQFFGEDLKDKNVATVGNKFVLRCGSGLTINLRQCFSITNSLVKSWNFRSIQIKILSKIFTSRILDRENFLNLKAIMNVNIVQINWLDKNTPLSVIRLNKVPLLSWYLQNKKFWNRLLI